MRLERNRFGSFTLMLTSLALFVSGLSPLFAEPPEPSRYLTVRGYDVGTPTHRAVWKNGKLLAVGTESNDFLFLDSSGDLIAESKIPDSIRIKLTSAAASSDGQFAVTGHNFDTNTPGASFIAWVDSTGAFTRVIWALGFRISSLAFAHDGTLWAAGTEYDLQTEKPPAAYNILRHYDTSGNEIKTALSSTVLKVEPDKDGIQHYPAENSYLVASAERIGLYSVTAKEWVEVTLASGDVTNHWGGPEPLVDPEITGVAFTETGEAYVSVNLPDKTGNKVVKGTYKLNKSTGRWLRFQVEHDEGVLIGADGSDLVIHIGPGQFAWFPTTSAN
jgi:hypothetical protein